MRKRSFYLMSVLFFFVVQLQAGTIDSQLKHKLQRAKADGVLIEVTIGLNETYIGKITEIEDTQFVLFNPLSEEIWTLPVERIQRLKQIKPLKHIVKSYLGKKRKVDAELIDGSVVSGKVVSLQETHFVLQDPKSGEKTRVEYSHLKTFPGEPEGQRIVRNAMISAGVGLAAAITLVAALVFASGD